MNEEEEWLLKNHLYRESHRYILEVSHDRIDWKFVAAFNEGDPSRFKKPFDTEVAINEANSFKNSERFKRANWKYTRIIIEL